MADSKITDLTETTDLDGTEELVLNDAGSDRKVTTGNIIKGSALVRNYYPLSDGTYRTVPQISLFSTTTSSSFTNGRLYAFVYTLLRPETINRLAINVSSAVASSAVRIGVYERGSDGNPGTLVFDSDSIDTSTTGVKEATITAGLLPKVGFLAFVSQFATTSATLTSCSATTAFSSATSNYNGLTSAGSAASNLLYVNSVSGALPDPFGTPAGSTNQSSARILFRVV